MRYEDFDNLQRRCERETNASVIQPISFEIFKKTPEEKLELKKVRSMHNFMLRQDHGSNWKKFIN